MLRSKGFVTALALMVLVGFSELSLSYASSVTLNLKTLKNLEMINERIVLENKMLKEFNQQLENAEDINDFLVDGQEVMVYKTDLGYILKMENLTLNLVIEAGEIVKIDD